MFDGCAHTARQDNNLGTRILLLACTTKTRPTTTGETNIPQNPRVGTKRYMAREILDMTMNMTVFENFRRVDIYSFGLMMWESTRRCMTYEGVEDYALPFYDMVSTINTPLIINVINV